MEKIRKYIADKRATLSDSSITTYTSILKNLYKKVFGDEDYDLSKFDNSDKVITFLKDVAPNKRKTILSALVIITDKKAYRDLMAEDVKAYNKEISKQIKTDEQEASWVGTQQVRELYEALKRNADLLYKKKTHTISDLQEIQNYVLLSVLGGIYVPPRRSKDFCDFKIKQIDKSKDNFLDKNKMIFNSFKTAKTYGTQDLEIPTQLRNILKKWISINPTDYLFFDSNMNPLSSVKLNQRLNKVFDKKVSVNQLRHTYLTDKFGETINTKNAVANTMEDMGSSSGMLDTYVKK